MVVITIKKPVKPESSSAPKIRIKGFNSSLYDASESLKDIEKKNIYGDEALGEVPVEEHLILQLPPHLSKNLSETLSKKQVPTDLALNFTDPRNGTFKLGNQSYSCSLVDLPCILESLKTIDNKQYYKIADISQMVVVDPKTIPKDYSWPDGLTPPLKNVRKQRFRQRMSKKAIEDVEKEVERLLVADAEAEDVIYEVHDRKDDDEYDEPVPTQEADPHHDDPDFLNELQEALEADTDDEKDDFDDQEVNRAEAAALMEDYDDEETVDGEDEDEEEEEEGDGGQETEEQIQLKEAIRLLKDEVRDLENKIEEKRLTAAAQINPIMKRRFEEIVNKLSKERDIKVEQLESLKEDLTSTREEAQNDEED